MTVKTLSGNEIIINNIEGVTHLFIDGEEHLLGQSSVATIRPRGDDFDAKGYARTLKLQVDILEDPRVFDEAMGEVVKSFRSFLDRNPAAKALVEARVEQTGKDDKGVLLEMIQAYKRITERKE